jgi:hypothetical protein
MHRRAIKPSRNGSGRHLAPAIYSPAPPKTGCTTCSKVPEQIISNCNRHLCALAQNQFSRPSMRRTQCAVIIEFCNQGPGVCKVRREFIMLAFLLETINKLRAEQKTRSALMRAIFTAEKFRNISLVSTLAILRRCRRIISRRSRNTASQQHAEYFERLNRFFARVNRQREKRN